MLATIYTSSAFGIQKIEVNIVDFGTKKYAQYNSAPFAQYVPKGKRKPTGFVVGYNPWVVILEGHGHINPQDAFEKLSSDDSVTVTKSIYASFDERYKTDFDKVITDYIADKKVLMDVRHTAGTNTVNK